MLIRKFPICSKLNLMYNVDVLCKQFLYCWILVFPPVWAGLLLCLQAGTIVSTSTSHCDATSSSSCCRHTFLPRLWWCFHGSHSGSTAGLCRPESPWVKKISSQMSFEEIVCAWGKSVCVKWWKLAVTWLHQLGTHTCMCEYTNLPRVYHSHFSFELFAVLGLLLYLSYRRLFSPSLRSFHGSSHHIPLTILNLNCSLSCQLYK